MYYEINVVKNKKHYFATSQRSLLTRNDALSLFEEFQILFPKSLGFELSVSERYESGVDITEVFIKALKPKQ